MHNGAYGNKSNSNNSRNYSKRDVDNKSISKTTPRSAI